MNKQEAVSPKATPRSGARPTVATPGASDSSLTEVAELRRRAREHVDAGAVTEGYRADREVVLKLLNEALATELVCVLRYRRHHFMATGLASKAVADEFMMHSTEEQGHADALARRITELNGEPNFNPIGLADRSHAEYVEGHQLVDMIKEDLVAERIAIDSYAEMIRYVGDGDPTTRRLLEGILAKEEEHATDMADLLTKQAKGSSLSTRPRGFAPPRRPVDCSAAWHGPNRNPGRATRPRVARGQQSLARGANRYPVYA